ncbi:EAL domain-containing protein [Clostridium sp. C2-6-12]|uniref:EAL and HDOD domain-containing protein n=1 Tax=Clostridium sp. C2-6-12 TaxID=2698832 RepID=UPI0013698B95|nr:EAL domain-containing protein [Clostridium sp. C2-6-12]
MDIFVARQPIFDRSHNVVGYELLYRNGYENFYSSTDGNRATLNVIANSFYTFGINNITNNKRAFINFTEELITKEVATILPSSSMVIEILEDIEPTDEVLLACKKLKEKGFTLALDDFIFHEKYVKFIELADIVKIDFKLTKGEDRKNILELSNINNKIKFLAEKVETEEDYRTAFELGYTYFQGYYFSEPVTLSRKCIPVNKHIAWKIINIISKEDFNYNELETLMMQDLGISYKILKLINSSLYYLKNKVSSIRRAITYIGKQELAKWLYIILLNDLKANTHNELIRISLLRAKLCEFICSMSIHKGKKFSAYMTGLFSLSDVILNCPINVIVNDLCMVDEIKDGLLEEKTPLNSILKLAICYEKGQWDEVIYYADKIKIDPNEISKAYLKSLKWADNVFYNN